MSYSQAKKAPIPPHTLTVSSNRKTLKPSASPRIMRSNVKGAEADFQSILFKSIAILFAILKWKCIAILQFCNIAPPEKVLQYCNTSILFTEKKPIIHKFDSAYKGGFWKTLVPKSLSRDFNRFLTEFWWYFQVYLNFSNFPIQFYIWKNQKTVSFFKVLRFNTS